MLSFLGAGLLSLAATRQGAAQVLGGDGGTLPGQLRHPLEPAARCSECHAGETDAQGNNYMAADTWQSSMMANASRDPLFLATLTVANQQAPGVGTFCLRCHSPSGFTAGRAVPPLGTGLDPVLGDADGVHCDTCHRSVVPTGASGPLLRNAQLYFQDAPEGELPPRHGPRSDPFQSPRHPSVGSAFVRDSRLCGQCHDVDHPTQNRLDPRDGRDTGARFPLQSTYSEWAQSDFARRANPETCQSCHMPEVGGEPIPVTRIPGAPVRPGQRRHDFQGANEWGMALLRAAFPGENDEGFDAARRQIQGYLRTAATVELIDPPRTAQAGATVQLRVRVTNLSGHKLPTGYEDARLMWLQVQVGDRVVSGAYANDELVEDGQARIYRFEPGHYADGRVTRSDFVVAHDTVLEDTRIPPLGMMPDDRTRPVGRDYSGGPGGALRNYDEATFALPMPATGGAVPITVRLLYRTTTRHYVEAIAGANTTDDRGRSLTQLFNATGRAAPFTMTTATASIAVTGGAPADEGGASCAARPSPATHPAALSLGALGLALVARRRRNKLRR